MIVLRSDSGETHVRRHATWGMYDSTFAAGRILNEKTARSQCIGGIVFGIGAALSEELVHDPRDGRIVNHDLAEYHVPVNADVPMMDIAFLPERDVWANPLQAKGIGELGISGLIFGRVLNDACGGGGGREPNNTCGLS